MQRNKIMVKKSKIRTLFLIPPALIIFLTGWCLQFIGSSKRGRQRKKPTYDMQIEVLEQDEKQIFETIKRWANARLQQTNTCSAKFSRAFNYYFNLQQRTPDWKDYKNLLEYRRRKKLRQLLPWQKLQSQNLNRKGSNLKFF